MAGMNAKKISDAFESIIDNLDRADLDEILLNWDDVELNNEGNLVRDRGRNRESPCAKRFAKRKVRKQEFLDWLVSNSPFDEAIYGPAIRSDVDWRRKIEMARTASGLLNFPESEQFNN